jgi:polyisoprenoid-binding protein YceI
MTPLVETDPMTRTTKFAIALLLPVLGAASTVASEAQTYVRDQNHSTINFQASSRLLDAQGYWEKWDAKIEFDAANIEKSSIAIDIDAKSVNTRIAQRDNHLRSCAFFCADSFPVITFKSKTIRPTVTPAADLANTKLIITGDLTIRGVTKTVSIPSTLVFFDSKANMGRVKGTYVVNRLDFGVGYNPPGNPVEPEVPVTFDVTFRAPAPGK